MSKHLRGETPEIDYCERPVGTESNSDTLDFSGLERAAKWYALVKIANRVIAILIVLAVGFFAGVEYQRSAVVHMSSVEFQHIEFDRLERFHKRAELELALEKLNAAQQKGDAK